MMIRNLIHQKGRWSSNYAAFNVSKCSYSNPVSLSQRNLDFDLDLKDEDFLRRFKTEKGPDDVASVVDKMKRMGLSEMKALEFVKKQEDVSKTNLRKICQNLDVLSGKGIKLQTILNNPWLLKMKTDRLKLSLSMIDSMEPRCPDDFIPFAKIRPMELIKIQQKQLQKKATVPGDRVYYVSRLLEAEPIVVADFFARYQNFFSRKFESIDKVVNVFRDFNIPLQDIADKPYVLLRAPKSIRKKFSKCKNMGLNDLKPDCLFLTEEQLKARVKSSNAKLEPKPIKEVLSERLGCPPEVISSLLEGNKALQLQDPAKTVEKLDYLLNEAGIPPIKVLRSFSILASRIEVIRRQLEQLRAMGHEPYTLSVVGVSRQRFEKYLKKLGETDENVKISAEL